MIVNDIQVLLIKNCFAEQLL